MSSQALLTRETLLLRLRNKADDRSWSEFVEIYAPMLFSYCLKRGIRREDAADLVQEVMQTVAKEMETFRYDRSRGTFRAWIHTLLRHALHRFLAKQERAPVTAARTAFLRQLEATPDPRENLDWERDYERELLAWAVGKAKPHFSVRIWELFEATALQGRAPAEVAAERGISKNAVSLAKFRVVEKLREIAASIDGEEWEFEALGNPDIS